MSIAEKIMMTSMIFTLLGIAIVKSESRDNYPDFVKIPTLIVTVVGLIAFIGSSLVAIWS